MNEVVRMAETNHVSHTPGSWRVGEMNHYGRIEIWSDEWFLASVATGVPTGQVEFNARLIAAAPELLTALKALLAYTGETLSPLALQALAAIAKAERKS